MTDNLGMRTTPRPEPPSLNAARPRLRIDGTVIENTIQRDRCFG